MAGIWLILTGLLLLFSAESMQAAYQTAQVFASCVLPALFPMMVVGSLLGESLPASVSRTGASLFQILFGFCAGSPAAARQLTVLDHKQPLQAANYRFLLCASGVMSPMFFTGTLANKLGGRAAWLLLISHWLGALVTGFLSLFLSLLRKPSVSPHTARQTQSPERRCFSALLPSAIEMAAHAQLSILGAMMVFSIIAALLRTLLASLFPAWTSAHSPWLAVGWAMMEIGGGALAMIDAFSAPPLWLLCALCSFGGLSIWLQNLLFLERKQHPVKLLVWRMIHGVLSGLICSFIQRCSGIAAWAETVPTASPLWGAYAFTPLHTNLLPLSALLILAAHPWRDPCSP